MTVIGCDLLKVDNNECTVLRKIGLNVVMYYDLTAHGRSS
jgi:hypothetical protein